MGKYIACICEGGAERAILDLLLENNKLIFEKENLIEEEILRCRKGKDFEERYLKKGFSEKITVYRILDSRKENFKLSPAYAKKVDVINVITAPEIEMLIILNEGLYSEFKKSGIKPSEFCKSKMKCKEIKTYDFVKAYFSNVDILIHAIYEYRRVSNVRNGEWTISDLLNREGGK